MKKIILAFGISLGLFAVNGCNQNGLNGAGSVGESVDPEELKFVSMTDQNESAFTVNMPEGWTSKVSLERNFGQIRNCGVANSPDGKIRLFFGDPSLPTFNVPMPEYGMFEGMQTGNPMSQVNNFIPADRFFRDYTKMAYGKKPGFKITGNIPDEKLKKIYEDGAQKVGVKVSVTAVEIAFEFTENNEKWVGKINGVCSLMETVWTPECNGYTATVANLNLAEGYRTAMTESFKTNSQWREKENQAFAMRMEQDRRNSNSQMQQMTNSHNQRMADMNQNFNAHQQRMGDMQASHDAYNQNWQNNQNSVDNQNQAWQNNQNRQDDQHRKNINLIRGEEQVRNGNQVGKVESGYNNYYVNPGNNQYIGTNSEPPSVPEGYEKWEVE